MSHPTIGADPLPRTYRSLYLIATTGVLVRLLIVVLTPEWSLSADGWRFIQLRDSGMDATAFIPPFYPFFLMLVEKIAGGSLTSIRVIQSLLGGVTIILTGVVASRLAPEAVRHRTALVGAGLAAFTPPLLLSDITVLSESWSALLLTLFLLLSASRTTTGSVLGGVALGVGSLCRPQTLPYGIARGMFIAYFSPAERRRAAIAVLLMLVVITPWAVRNYFIFERIVPVSTNGGYNFWKSFHPDNHGTEDQSYDTRIYDAMDESEFDAYGYSEGLWFILQRPVDAVLLAPLKVGHFLGLERLFFIGLRDNFWGPVPLPVVALAAFAIPATQIFWMFFGTVGLLRSPASAMRNEILGLLAFTGLFHLVFNGVSRYHLPLVPIMLAAAAAGVCTVKSTSSRTWKRLLPFAVTAVVVFFWGYEVLLEWPEIRRSLGD